MSDFRRIADAALARADSLVPMWLPDGRRSGSEWSALNPTRGDTSRGSFSVNLATGKWSDFATGDSGGDLVALCAYLFHAGDQLAALKQLAEHLGETLSPFHDRSQRGPDWPEDKTPRGSVPEPEKKPKTASPWRPIVPVPADSGPVPKAHTFRGRPDYTWAYHDQAGHLLGIVCRFTTSDGGKEVLPCVYAEHETTGVRQWRWMAFPAPRPLYGLWDLRPDGDVLVVEGEKCRDAAHKEIGGDFSVLSWPGGGKAVKLADWTPLSGRRVILWPDCDAQTDKAGDILAEKEQPGTKAMAAIAKTLQGLGCEVLRMTIPAPGTKPSGWDVADAIEAGVTGERLAAWVVEHAEPVNSPKPEEKADPADAALPWRELLLRKPRTGELQECRENVYLFLSNHPALAERIAVDEFANAIVKTDKLPWASHDAEWQEIDDLRLGYWLADSNGLLIRSTEALRHGVTLAASERRIHPVRDWLQGLSWDGTARLSEWLAQCMGAAPTTYHALAGRFWLISMVARIFDPGCKVDAMVVLEGEQGGGKSSSLRLLAGEHFSDTPFVMGDKDSFLALRGRWLYEISELDSLNRADITRAKAFLSSQVDNYRAPYEARPENHKRQCVFAATTNQYEYLRDLTGNRRFWPVRCHEIDLTKLAAWREQLFAEACVAYRAGQRWYPDREEFETHFEPEIDRRLLDDPWETTIADWCDSPDAQFDLKHDGVTVARVLKEAIKMDASKIGGARVESARVGTIMKRLGYARRRRATGRREWAYVMEAPTARQTSEGAADANLPL
ncbi:VapE domain-containing protein [Methylolobus aquaticus]